MVLAVLKLMHRDGRDQWKAWENPDALDILHSNTNTLNWLTGEISDYK